MGTSAALACFTFALLAMNFATYFAEEEMTHAEVLKSLCGNKAYREGFDFCFKEKASPLMKELFSFCAKDVGLIGEFSLKSLFEVSCVKGGAKIYIQFYDNVAKEQSKRKLTVEEYNKGAQPFLNCVLDKLLPKSK